MAREDITSLIDAYGHINRGREPDFEGLGLLNSLRLPRPKVEPVAVAGLIVELRPHWNLLHVIKRVMSGLNIPVTIVYGLRNKKMIEKSRFLQREIRRGNLRAIQLELENINRPQYTALFMSEVLWEAIIPGRQILVFQTDSTICLSSRFRLSDFRDLDYVGSYMPNPRPSGLWIDGGNGGLSLRGYEATIQAIKDGVPSEWPSPEDDYFASHIHLFGGNVADAVTSKRFGTQVVFQERSFGVHNPGGLRTFDFLRLLMYCPDSIRCHRGKILGVAIESLFRPFAFTRG